MGTVDSSYQPKVTRYCGIHRVPTIVGVVSGRVMHYGGHALNSRNIKEFIRTIIPSGLAPTVSAHGEELKTLTACNLQLIDVECC